MARPKVPQQTMNQVRRLTQQIESAAHELRLATLRAPNVQRMSDLRSAILRLSQRLDVLFTSIETEVQRAALLARVEDDTEESAYVSTPVTRYRS